MKCTLDGRQIHDVSSFIRELNRAVTNATGEPADFGWELNTMLDHLHGGYGGTPPYEITVEHAEPMVGAMDHRGLVDYCTAMLDVIDRGGGPMVDETSRAWFERTRAEASQGQGPTLLDLLFDTLESAPVELVLRASSGEVLRTSRATS